MTILGTVLGVCVIIYTINCVLVSMRSEIGMEFVPPRGIDVW